jgi:hypothetical protein
VTKTSAYITGDHGPTLQEYYLDEWRRGEHGKVMRTLRDMPGAQSSRLAVWIYRSLDDEGRELFSEKLLREYR